MSKSSGFAETSSGFALVKRSVQTTLGPDGRLLIPAAVRDAAGIQRGEKVVLRVEDGRIVVTSLKADLKKLNGLFAHLKKPGESVVDEFIAERRAESARESDE